MEIREVDAVDVPAGAWLLDVREPVEWAAGHIDGARHIPLGQVPARLAELPADADVIVVCKVGGRSAQVTAYLADRGYRATNLRGGVVAWLAAGKPLVSETAAPPSVY